MSTYYIDEAAPHLHESIALYTTFLFVWAKPVARLRPNIPSEAHAVETHAEHADGITSGTKTVSSGGNALVDDVADV